MPSSRPAILWDAISVTEVSVSQIDVSIIIVSYNTADLTAAAIKSVYDETRASSFEVIVVDNASSDGSADLIAKQYPQVRLTRLKTNVGFAAANNLAAAEANGRYVLLLNPDTVVLNGAIDTLVAFADEHPLYGVYGGSTFYPDGSRNPTAGWNKATVWSLFCAATGLMSVFRGSPLFDPESLASWDWQSAREVGIVTGCFMLLDRAFWNELGGFDERFHMYAEDADISLRSAAAGRPAVICPAAAIVHYGGASEPVYADRMVRLLTAKVQLFRKHWRGPAAWYAVTMLKTWVFTRALYTRVKDAPRGVAQTDSWPAVWRRRKEWIGARDVQTC